MPSVTAFFTRFMTAIQLTRLTVAFGAVSDLWFVILLARAEAAKAANVTAVAAGETAEVAGDVMAAGTTGPLAGVVSMSLAAALAAGAIIAIGLFAFGASLNDVLDVRHDTTFRPDRPIPAGRIGFVQAVVITVTSLMIAVLAGVWIGLWSVCAVLLTAAGILFYNVTGKFIPSVGVVTIGLIHAAHMYIPNAALSFTAPVWLVMTHAMGIAAAVHVLEDKRPRFDRRAIALCGIGWLFWTGVLFWTSGLGPGQLWPDDVSIWRAGGALLVALSFIAVARHKTRNISGKRAAEKVQRYGAMWQSLYGAAWLWALGHERPAIWIGLFALAGFALMTLIKEVTGFSGRPVDFRAE